MKRSIFSSLTLMASAVFALTVPAAAAAQSFEECTALEDDSERLACYDRVTREGAAPPPEPGADEAGQEVAPSSQAGEAPEEAAGDAAPQESESEPGPEPDPQHFGFESKGKHVTPEEIETTLVKAQQSSFGRWFVTLENGQVWRQVDWTKARVAQQPLGSRVTISKTLMGAFSLKVGRARAFRAERVE